VEAVNAQRIGLKLWSSQKRCLFGTYISTGYKRPSQHAASAWSDSKKWRARRDSNSWPPDS